MTNRIYTHLVLIVGSWGYISFASADVFMCGQAERFGFSDSLCEKPNNRLAVLGEQLKLDAPVGWGAQDFHTDTRPMAFGQGKTHWQGEWSNRRDWEHVHGWNAFQAFYPFTGHFDHDWFQLRLPHVHRRAVSPASRPGSKPKVPTP